MNLLWLSTGLFRDRYGQQNYEVNFLEQIYKLRAPADCLRVLLLNDFFLPAQWQKLPYLRFICCGRQHRFFSKCKLVLSSLLTCIKDRPELIVCGHVHLSFLGYCLSRLFKIKYLLLTYGMDAWDIKNKFQLKGLSGARIIVSMSHYTATKIKEQAPLLEKKFFVIPGFVDTQKFAPSPKPENLIVKYGLAQSKILLTVARLSAIENKGYEKVIRLLPTLIKVIPQIKYIIVGAGDDIPNIKRLVNDLGLSGYVILAGFVAHEDLAAHYNLCDCFLMPSVQEGFGIVFLEALACGKPVIAGNLDGSREALLNGKLGLLVNPNDPRQIEEAIIKVLKKEADSALLDADFLRRSVIDNFSLASFQQRVPHVLNYINNECICA